MDRIIRMTELVQLLGQSRSTINRKRKEGRFPKPIQLGGNSIGWRESVIENYLDSLLDAAM